ncbi:hypothetical protein OKW24_002841 [Peribacillus simplex]|nr:hypothetical protein [Peribacillus simplex]
MKLGNADGGKASYQLSPLLGTHLLHAVVGIINGNKTIKDSRISKRKSFTWDKFRLFLNKYPLPSPRIKANIYDLRKEISYIL